MGLNFKSFRIQKIKNKLTAITKLTQETPYTRQVALLHELLKIETISLRNCRFCRKYIHTVMMDMYRDPQTRAEMEKLEGLFAAAEQRRIRRREKRQALKDQAAAPDTPGKRGRKPKGAPTAPAEPAPSPTALWEKMLQEQKEKDRGT